MRPGRLMVATCRRPKLNLGEIRRTGDAIALHRTKRNLADHPEGPLQRDVLARDGALPRRIFGQVCKPQVPVVAMRVTVYVDRGACADPHYKGIGFSAKLTQAGPKDVEHFPDQLARFNMLTWLNGRPP
jgi:hypothetical protein